MDRFSKKPAPIISLNVNISMKKFHDPAVHKVRFASFLSGKFTAMAVINPPERNLAKRTSVQWTAVKVE